MKRYNRLWSWFLVFVLGTSWIVNPAAVNIVRAATAGRVVINEIAWAGSTDSAYDEWIELYNDSDQPVDLSGWSIDNNHGHAIYKILNGTIAAHDYFLIEDHESAVSSITSDAIMNLSLANAGVTLQLYDSAHQLLDTVNSSGGAWFAGNSTTKATMERIDPAVGGDLASNWKTSGGSSAKASGGANIIGTPRAETSASTNNGNTDTSVGNSTVQPQITLLPSSENPVTGDVLKVSVIVADARNLSSYGFEITYDPTVFRYKAATEGDFLSQAGTISTSFHSGLQNGQEGVLLFADAQTQKPAAGVNGSGTLAGLDFDVIAQPENSSFAIGERSFLSSSLSDIDAKFNDLAISSAPVQPESVTGLVAVSYSDRYSIRLTWDDTVQSGLYRVYRKDPHNQFKILSETTELDFIDKDGVTNGGSIVPGVNYVYQVVAVKQGVESQPTEVVAQENRGLKGDNNRSDLVDGRDLQVLAEHFGQDDSEGSFAPLADTTYDGRIDGNDLIDFGSNFAKTWQ